MIQGSLILKGTMKQYFENYLNEYSKVVEKLQKN